MGHYKYVPTRRKNNYQRRYKNQQKRKDSACGVIGLICVGLGAAAGGWGGAAIGFLVAGLVVWFICNNPNP